MSKRKRKFVNGHATSILNGHIDEPKSKLTKSEVNDDAKKISDGFKKFREKICSDQEMQQKSWKKLLKLLRENQQNSAFRMAIGPLCDLKFLAGILWRYNCTLGDEDLLLYDILAHLEKHLCLDFRIASPLVFGERSKTYYDEMVKYGRNLHKYLSPDQVMEYFDQKRLWKTLLKMTKFVWTANGSDGAKGLDASCYDPRFVLRTLVQLVKPGTKLSCKQMVTSNALSFCFASTSFNDARLRALSYAFLVRFRRRLFELTDENFPQRVIYKVMLDVFQNGMDHINQRANHHVSQFMARASKLALSPEDPLYAPLMSFFTQRPFIQLDCVPEFYKLFFSGSTEFCHKERQWVLRLLADSIVDSADYGAMCRVFALESCMALFCTPLADYWSKLALFKIFRACIQLNSAARDMFIRLDFSTWLANAITHKRTTAMEQTEMATLFISLATQVKQIGTATEDVKGRKLTESERRWPYMSAKLWINAKRIVEYLEAEQRIVVDNKEIERRAELVKLMREQLY